MTPPTLKKTSKAARVLTMLAKPKGASLGVICTATGWQPHSARAAISGLRKAGHAIERLPGDGKGGASVYRITSAPKAPE